jgi:hypothetical protein
MHAAWQVGVAVVVVNFGRSSTYLSSDNGVDVLISKDAISSKADAGKLLHQALLILDDLSLSHAGVHVAMAIDLLEGAMPTAQPDKRDGGP